MFEIVAIYICVTDWKPGTIRGTLTIMKFFLSVVKYNYGTRFCFYRLLPGYQPQTLLGASTENGYPSSNYSSNKISGRMLSQLSVIVHSWRSRGSQKNLLSGETIWIVQPFICPDSEEQSRDSRLGEFQSAAVAIDGTPCAKIAK